MWNHLHCIDIFSCFLRRLRSCEMGDPPDNAKQVPEKL